MICAPTACSRSGDMALTVPLVPTGMKHGVGPRPAASRDARPGLAVLRLEREGEVGQTVKRPHRAPPTSMASPKLKNRYLMAMASA